MTVRTPYLDNDLVQLFYQAPESVRKDNTVSRRLIRDGNPDLAVIMTDRGVSIGPGMPLSKIARIYREILFRAEYFYNEGTPDWLTRADHAMRPLHANRCRKLGGLAKQRLGTVSIPLGQYIKRSGNKQYRCTQ